MRARLVGGVIAAATAALLAAGCSDSGGAPPATGPTSATSSPAPSAPISPEHNQADVVFVRGMIPHHQQAIAMSTQAADRASSPEVKALAARIDQEQAPEIEQMNQMLEAWGAPRPQPGSTAMPGMPMGDTAMHGMMSDEQMQHLAAQAGASFDRMFLQMMIEHHTGAVQMAQTEQAQGLNPQAKELAGAIVVAQQREITEMQALLGRV